MIANPSSRPEAMLPRLLLAVLVTSVVGWLGCGGGQQPAPEPQAAAPAPAGQPSAAGTAPAAAPAVTPAAAAAVDPDRKETKWIGKIPYDVFYDQPLSIAANTTSIGGTQETSVTPNQPNPVAEAGTANMPTPATGGSPAPAAGAGIDWAKTMPMEMLMTEIKTLRSQLQTNLQTVATYNRGVNEISNDAAILAGLIGIVERHPEETNWKPNAHIVRELAYQVYSNAEGSGRSAYEKTQLPFEQLCTIMDGGSAPEVDAEPNAPFADYAYLSEIMKWFEKRFTDLKSNVNTEARLKEDPLAIERRLRMLEAFGRMMGTEGYSSSDEKKYQGFVTMFVDGGMSAVDAAKAGDFDAYQAALNQVQTSCGECHQQYRGSDSGF